jgi:hypothetical protein
MIVHAHPRQQVTKDQLLQAEIRAGTLVIAIQSSVLSFQSSGFSHHQGLQCFSWEGRIKTIGEITIEERLIAED